MYSRQRNAEVADAVRARQKPSQNARVRAISERAGCECLCKPDALVCQLVERGSTDSSVPVAVNVIGAQRIDGNEKNVSMRCPVLYNLPGDATVSNQTAAE